MRFFNEFLGYEITVPDEPRRIVSLAPDMTDMVFRLGLGDRLVGVSLYCWRPQGRVEHLPKVGAYLKVVWERLEGLRPDLVLTTLGAQRETTRELIERGYPVVALPVPLSLWGILENLRRLAAVLNALPQAEAENARLVAQLQELRGGFSGLQVYWEVDLGGPITAGGMAYVTDALHWLGLRNVYADYAQAYFQPDDTETRSRKPDLILYEPKRTRTPQEERWRAMLHERLGDIPVVVLPHDSLAHYGPALIDEVLPEVARRVRAEMLRRRAATRQCSPDGPARK